MAEYITIESQALTRAIAAIVSAGGSSATEAQQVAESLVGANLTGHDSHGVLRVPWYLRAVREGQTNPHAQIRVERESATTAIVDCDDAFGQVAALEGMRLAVDKARHVAQRSGTSLAKGAHWQVAGDLQSGTEVRLCFKRYCWRRMVRLMLDKP